MHVMFSKVVLQEHMSCPKLADVPWQYIYLHVWLCTEDAPYSTTYRGQDIEGSTIGLAYVGTMCSRYINVGLTQDGGRGSLEVIGATAAHELGHIFNMNHDVSSKD